MSWRRINFEKRHQIKGKPKNTPWNVEDAGVLTKYSKGKYLSHEKKNNLTTFPLYWLVNKDPYNGIIIIPI